MISSVLRLAAIAAFVVTAATSTGVQAATCTIQGTITFDPMDTYYCDSSWLSCAGWNEVDLDGTKPVRNMQVALGLAGVFAGTATTDANGNYSMTIPGLNCTSTYEFYTVYMRPGTGTNSPMFKIVDEGLHTHASYSSVQLTGPTTTYNRFVGRATSPNIYKRLHTLHYTINSALTEMRSWSTNLATRLGGGSASKTITVSFYETQLSDNADDLAWGVKLGYTRWAWGANTRHELGHLVHMSAHNGNLHHRYDESCVSLRFNSPGNPALTNSHGEESCEWASAATWEGLATFFAVRSLVEEGATENGAFFCFGSCSENAPPTANQDFCSEAAYNSLQADRNQSVPICTDSVGLSWTGWFTGVGDTYATNVTNCARVRSSQGCNCTDTSPADGFCDEPPGGGGFYQTNGHRNEVNVERFMWDVIDVYNEGGGLDDTTMDITSLIAGLEAMGCTSTGGVEGTCNETGSTGSCIPSSESALPGPHVTGDRDSYNPKDLSDYAGIPGNQDGELQVNCLQNAPD